MPFSISFGGGWFFLAASEAITVLNQELLLPGIGSFMAVAVSAADGRALAWAVLAMVTLVVVVDTLFWRPLVAWAGKFKFEESGAATAPGSRVLEIFRRSHLVPWLEARLAGLDEALDPTRRRRGGAPTDEPPTPP